MHLQPARFSQSQFNVSARILTSLASPAALQDHFGRGQMADLLYSALFAVIGVNVMVVILATVGAINRKDLIE